MIKKPRIAAAVVTGSLQKITKDNAFSNRPTGPNKAKCKNKIKMYIKLEIRGDLCDVAWLEMFV